MAKVGMGVSCLPLKVVHGLPVSPLWNVCKGCNLGPCFGSLDITQGRLVFGSRETSP